MLPPDLVDLNERLDEAIKKHKVEPLREAIVAAAEPQVLVFEKSGAGGNASLGDLHELRGRRVLGAGAGGRARSCAA